MIKIKKDKGFVVLFAITLSAIFFSVALGVSNIALKQSKFSISAKETNDAFFAADSGVEYYYYMVIKDNFCPYTLGDPIVARCNLNSVPALGSTSKNCARVDVTKSTKIADDGFNQYMSLNIVSKGYNVTSNPCPPAADSVEREIVADFAI